MNSKSANVAQINFEEIDLELNRNTSEREAIIDKLKHSKCEIYLVGTTYIIKRSKKKDSFLFK